MKKEKIDDYGELDELEETYGSEISSKVKNVIQKSKKSKKPIKFHKYSNDNYSK